MEDAEATAEGFERVQGLKRSKRNCLKVAFAAGMVYGFLWGLLPEESFPVYLLDNAIPFISIIVGVFWCYYDSIERDIYITRNQYIAFCLLFPIAFWFYVFRTRGWSGFKTLLAFALLTVLYILTFVVAALSGALLSGKLFSGWY